VRGFPKTTLLLQGVGTVEQVTSELCGPSRVWRSLTPYLPVRHYQRNRGPYDEFLTDDVRHELRYRDVSTDVQVSRDRSRDRWALEFRRYREGERLRRDPRPGFGLTLTFAEPEKGPVLLGQLSHFGFGVFVPAADAGQ
jgi:CRISPR-associated protein Csb2